MTPRHALLALFLLLTPFPLFAADWPQFRGPDRSGISKETGLLKSWPKDGPKLLWTYKDAGLGFSCPIIVGDMLYTMGGFDKDEYVLAIDMKKQKEQWRVKVGPLFIYANWGAGPRSSPTIDGDKLYALGGHGDLVCLDLAKEGKEVWRKNYAKNFDGVMMSEWGFSESVLIDGKHLICTPGGAKGTLACLHKDTGAEVWRSQDLTNKAPYSSIMAADIGGVRQYIQNSYIDDKKGGVIAGIEAKKGDVLWSAPIFKGHSYAVAPTPVLKDNLVYNTAGSGGGCHCFEITKAGAAFKATDLFDKEFRKEVKNNQGGVVLIGDHIYGHSENQRWVCQDFKKGELLWEEKNHHTCTNGAIIAAEGLLYLLTDVGGVVLVEADPKAFKEISSFKLPAQSALRKLLISRAAGVWTIPVIAHGRLYLRDQDLIFCYDVKDNK